ncbi:MAG: riboflavin kinase, partial [Bryobacteraceae bacterium]
MRIARTVDEASGFEPSVLTIGNFDGVHLGHRKLFDQVIAAARERGLRATVLTFDPHPACIVAPQRAPRLLTTVEERCELMREQGLEQVFILRFTAEIAHLSPEEFVRRMIVDALRARIVLVGANFRFGYKQAGNTRVLAEMAEANGYETRVAGAVKCRGEIVSSSLIRRSIQAGEVSRARRFLGRPYSIAGEVVQGHGIGAKQTVPTLNLRT